MQRIEIVRGTTNTLQISVVDALGVPYNLGSSEKIMFGLKKDVKKDTVPIFQKTADIIDQGLFKVVLVPEDTENLMDELYYYDVGLQSGNDLFNIIPLNPFRIIPNVVVREV